MFSPTILYIKTHTVTGMKYFGKTCSLDRISRYWGSGKYWRKHLEKHGATFTTQVVGFYLEEERCVQAALKFSKDNDIVKRPDWANLVIENGLDGTAYGSKKQPRTEEQRKAQCVPRGPYKARQQENRNKGKPTGKRPTNADTVRKCPVCSHEGKGPNMFRYHFNKCKGL